MKDEALKLALEALENSVDLVREDAYNAEKLYGNYPTRQGKVGGLKILADDHEKAITAIKQALALDKMAENARELGLDYNFRDLGLTYEPAQQEPVPMTFDEAWASLSWQEWRMKSPQALFAELHRLTTPPAQPAPVQEPSFKEWSDNYVRDNIHKLKAQPAPTQDIPDLIAGALGVSRGTAYDLMREALKEAPTVQEPESFEQWNAKQHGDPEEIGFLQALRIAYCSGQDSIIKATPPAAQPAPVQQEPIGYAVPTFDFDNSVIKKVHYAGTVPLYTIPPAAQPAPVQDVDWKDMYEKEKRRSEMWVAKYEKDIGPLEYAVPVAALVHEPVALDVTIDDEDALAYLRDMVGQSDGDLTPIRLIVGDGYSGRGLYLFSADYSDEGGIKIADVATTPPAAQRKPLTDEEIESINVRLAGSRDLARLFARAIEAAHGIKENT